MPPLKLDGSNGISGIDGTVNRPAVVGVATTTGLQFGTDEINFVTGGTNRATVESNGNFTIESGNLVLASGSGIDFSASADGSGTVTSELLDEYEEGSWTPTMLFGGNSVGQSFVTGPFGSYTKIGNQVCLRLSFRFSNKGTSTGSFTVSGLPFASTNLGSYQHPMGICWIAQSPVNGAPIIAAVQSGATLIFRDLHQTSGDVIPTNANFDNDTALMLSMVYDTPT
ncbi:hypothetical protein HOU04_gp068 [Synechococcus phage S-T4]|uniref:Uncharacterized protein n=1 Tax=Synechococcus phage S-T4 TaxID=2268578 RepID=A0A385EHG7_9CAUD|nr:hypothetical protein HOU04_gp068 [Synechococcus phage S-T4]AXQ70467.1 hypothetical protein [Synechococcus phage S-T4]